MNKIEKRSHRNKLSIIFILSVILMVIRVDWWWWGTKIKPLVFGWLSIPMLYQIGIWLVGTALVLWLCLDVWKNDEYEVE